MLTALLMLFGMSAYAQNAFPEGDVNHDGKVDNADIEEVVKIIVGTSTLENPEVVGDVSGDGHVNVVDIVKIVNIMNTSAPVEGNPVITFSVNIINNTGSDVTLDGELEFVLGNPDHNGFYLGWPGSYNNTDGLIRFSDEAVTIPAGETKSFENLTWKDEDTQMGMGEKSPANADQLAFAGRSKNVRVYVNGNPEIVTCDDMPTDIVFQEGGVYNIVLSSVSNTEPGPVNPDHAVISFGVNIENNTGTDVVLNGELVFVLGNPNHNGKYFGTYQGPYLRTDHIRFSDSSVTIPAGETRTFSGLSWRDGDTGLGMGEMSPANSAQLEIAQRNSNVLVYVTELDGTANSEIVLCTPMDPNTIFRNGETYTISLAYSGTTPYSGSDPGTDPGSDPGTDPGSDPGSNPEVGEDHAVISFGVNIENNTGTDVVLNGELVFVLGNPNHNGKYFGTYQGPYLRTDHIRFSDSSVTIPAGETRTFSGLSWRDGDTGLGMGEMSPANSAQLEIAQRNSNVLVYVTELDGTANSEIVLCTPMDPNTIFRNGETYTISLAYSGTTPYSGSDPGTDPGSDPGTDPGSDPGSNPEVGEDHAVISFAVNITNAHGSPIKLNGDVVFVLGNPNHNGKYFGTYQGPYLRTDHIYFSSPVTIGAGETKTFSGLSWRDRDTGLGMGEMSPANSTELAIAQRRSNVLLYVLEPDGTANSEIVICDPMDPNIIFQNNGTYNIVFR